MRREQQVVSKNAERIARLERMREEARQGGGPVRVERQHAWGKLTARERLDLLLDPGSFVEFDAFVTNRTTVSGLDRQHFLGDGVVTGHGTIAGRLVFIFSQDFTVFGGCVRGLCGENLQGHGHGDEDRRAHHRSQRLGWRTYSGRRRVARRLCRHLPAQRPGVRRCAADLRHPRSVRRRSGILPAITDFVVMVRSTSYMFVTGPDVIKAVTHEDVDVETSAAPACTPAKSGVAHFAASDEARPRPCQAADRPHAEEQHGGPADVRARPIPSTAGPASWMIHAGQPHNARTT